ncbi:MAG TPA: glycosyltransferase [Acidimicrobiales bacterium]
MPRFSIVTPVYDPPADVLEAMLASVRAQTFTDWEHVLVDDASPSPHVQSILRKAAAADPRVKVQRRAENGGIVAASNDALALATGEFVALLDHDDELHRDALRLVHEKLAAHPEADYCYTDEDKIDEHGRHSAAFFKPAWSPERFRTQMYTCHLSVLRRSLVEEVGGFHAEFEGSQDWDLVLRVTEKARAVVHVPEVLYHWRTLPSSTASEHAGEAKPYAFEAGTRALQAHCDRTGFQATVVADPTLRGTYHLQPRLEETPLVSIVIPTAGSKREVRGEVITLVTHAVRSIVTASTYPDYEIVVVADPTLTPDVRSELLELAGKRLRIVAFDREFHYSQKINVGVINSRGEHVLMLNDDIEVITPDWIERMVMYSREPEIGAVGAKLFFSDGRIQHAGVVFLHSGPNHVYHGFARDYVGYYANALVAANYSAVTGACVMSRRSVFDEVGGLTQRLPLNFNDMDYCLKLRDKGYRIVLDPDCQLYHFESSSRQTEVRPWEHHLLNDRWRHTFSPDPYYNPNFGELTVDFIPPVYMADGSVA